MSNEDFAHMKEVRNSNTLTDIQNIKFNQELPLKEMLEEYIQKVKNPYHLKSGDVEIEIVYSQSSKKTISDLMKDYFLRNK